MAHISHQRELQESQERLHSLVTHHPDAVFALDRDGLYTGVNPACERLSGWPPEQVIGILFGDRTVNPGQAKRAFQRALAGAPHTFESIMISRTGRHVPVQITLVPIIVDGSSVGVYGITKDISDWKRAEATLASHARQQTALADLGLLALTDIAPGVLSTTVVEMVANLLGVESVALLEPVPETTFFQVTAAVGLPDSVEIPTGWLEPALDHRDSARLSSGALKSLRQAAPLIGISGPRAGLATRVPGRARAHGALLVLTGERRIFSDVETRFAQQVANVLGAAIDSQQAAEELRRRESDLKVLVEHTPDNIVRFDSSLRFMYINPALERMIGAPAGSVVGRTLGGVGEVDEQLSTWERKIRRVFRSGEEDELEATYGERCFQVLLCPEFGPDGEVTAVLGVGRDITANKQREAERSELYQALLERDTRLHELVERVLLNQQEIRHGRGDGPVAEQFTARERNILRLLARGLTNRQIGEEVNLRPSTVKNHIATLVQRLNAQDRTQAAVVAAQLGLLEFDGTEA